jgi:hypothetical protein
MKKPRLPPALALFLLSPTIGELLSGSSPPLEFFNPISFLLLASLYGSGAIIMRELKIRWKKDYRSLFLFGAAYGILEEGLMVKRFFDPNWIDLGILGSYGRWIKVNWVWAEMLTIYHAVFSIIIPIALAELAFPNRKEESWVSNRVLATLIALLSGVTVFGYFFLTQYRPPMPQYTLAIFAVAIFIPAGYVLQPRTEPKANRRTPRGKTLFALGTIASTTFFLLYWAGPSLIDSPIVIIILGIIQVFIATKLIALVDWTSAHANLNRLALVAGGLSFLIFSDFMLEFNPAARGMSIVGLATIAAILLFRRRIKARE